MFLHAYQFWTKIPQNDYSGTVGTYFANRLQINFIELGLDSHFLVTGRASKVINTPKIEDNYWY